jgi:transcriptional repressor NrdR
VRCPYCSLDLTRVVDSRLSDPGDAVRRRRQCEGCGSRFTTYERAEGPMLIVCKRDGRREQFDRDKLVRGLLRAAAKRPVEVSALERIADSIAGEMRRLGGEADAEWVGERALRGLVSLDRVAALLFASVYRSFEDLSDFEAELRRLGSEPYPGAGQLPLEAPVPSELGGNIGLSPASRSRGREGASNLTRRGHAAHP